MSFCWIVMAIFKGVFFFRFGIAKTQTVFRLPRFYTVPVQCNAHIIIYWKVYNSVIILTGWKRRPAHLSINEKIYILYYTLPVHAWWLYHNIYLRSYNIFACVSSGRERYICIIKYLPARETSICAYILRA